MFSKKDILELIIGFFLLSAASLMTMAVIGMGIRILDWFLAPIGW